MITQLLRQLPAETAHKWAIEGLKRAPRALPAPWRFSNLVYDCGLGKPLASPIGLAAGFDKDAEAILGCLRMGFGAVEVGSITPQPQPGNDRPRVFRLLEDQAVINRYGFNSKGARYAAAQIQAIKPKRITAPLGINLGKNKTTDALDDYRNGIKTFAPLADYLTINLSSPNTPGLRDQQHLSAIQALITGLDDVWPDKPVLVKLAPDVADEDLGPLVEFLGTTKVGGIILGNTTLSRPNTLASGNASETGGLSGAPLYPLALAKLRLAARVNHGLPRDQQMLLVGCGGIDSAHKALQMIRAGAGMVQMYSALSVHGPARLRHINAEISAILDNDGISNIRQVIGADL